MYFLVKRLPNDTDVSDLVDLLGTFHISVTFVVSEKPSGGMNQQVLYTLATKTNGICIFAEDYMLQEVWDFLGFKKFIYLDANLVAINLAFILGLFSQCRSQINRISHSPSF